MPRRGFSKITRGNKQPNNPTTVGTSGLKGSILINYPGGKGCWVVGLLIFDIKKSGAKAQVKVVWLFIVFVSAFADRKGPKAVYCNKQP